MTDYWNRLNPFTFFTYFVFIILFFFFVQNIHAATDRQPKTFKGKVRDQSNAIVKDATVIIICGTHTMYSTSNTFGNYSVNFATGECVQFDTITVNAQKDGLSGSTSKVATFALTNELSDIILAPISVPEFSAVTALLTASLSIMLYSSWKRIYAFSSEAWKQIDGERVGQEISVIVLRCSIQDNPVVVLK